MNEKNETKRIGRKQKVNEKTDGMRRIKQKYDAKRGKRGIEL